ncbi:hypothetical protein [Streptomyces aureocirculatus]|uniref:hypothetical protein n=1 Tax=Streptomyces aureocirculatus TaxID=67275 RepID=UPI001CED0DFD|nr:hypothetical protein [Streptomyces aureocirculatus]
MTSFAWSDDPPDGLDVAALEFLAADTAHRAAHLLRQALQPDATGLPPLAPPALSAEEDLVRLAAADPPTGIFTRLAFRSHRTPTALTRAAHAWQYGGAPALHILNQPWDPDPHHLDAARQQIRHTRDDEQPLALRTTRTRLTAVGYGVQLRLGTDARLWYPYRKKQGTWWPAGYPNTDPAEALNEVID